MTGPGLTLLSRLQTYQAGASLGGLLTSLQQLNILRMLKWTMFEADSIGSRCANRADLLFEGLSEDATLVDNNTVKEESGVFGARLI